MGLSAAAASISALPAAVLRRRRCSSGFPVRLSSPSASASGSGSGSAASVAVTRLFGRSSTSVLPSSSELKLSSSASSSSAAAAAAEESRNTTAAALRLRHGWYPNCGLQTRSSFRTFATMSDEFAESVTKNPGLYEKPDEATKGYILQQTMYRIKDPKISLDFYTRILGMSLLKRLDFPENKFSLYFLGYEDAASAPTNAVERVAWTFEKTGTLELTHNWGTELDKNFKGHHNGNSEPRGYGHIGITVDDTYKACERFENLGVKFVKRPDDGKMKGLAFIQDPDGYWIEIFDIKNMRKVTAKD